MQDHPSLAKKYRKPENWPIPAKKQPEIPVSQEGKTTQTDTFACHSFC